MTAQSEAHQNRAELAAWYGDRLRPKIVAAAQSGKISLGELVALDDLLEPLLPPVSRVAVDTAGRGTRPA